MGRGSSAGLLFAWAVSSGLAWSTGSPVQAGVGRWLQLDVNCHSLSSARRGFAKGCRGPMVARGRRYGDMMRPGAPSKPVGEWQ